MEINDYRKTPVNWGEFTHEQRKKTIGWLSEHLGKKFYTELKFKTKEKIPCLERSRNLLNLSDNMNGAFDGIVTALSVKDGVYCSLFYVSTAVVKEKMYVSLNLRPYKTKEEMEKEDMGFRSTPLFVDLAEKARPLAQKEADEYVEKGTPFFVVKRDEDPEEKWGYFLNEPMAVHDAQFLTRQLLHFHRDEKAIDAYNSGEIDWRKPYYYLLDRKDVIKEKFSDCPCCFKGTSFFDKLKDESLVEEFREFVKTI